MSTPGERLPEFFGRDRKHDNLQSDLLAYLSGQPNRAAWGEIEVGNCRPDAIAFDTRRNRLRSPHIYEVKANRADFTQEIRTEKWRKYLPHCCRFDFVTPAGLCQRSEIPQEAGWLVFEDGRFTRRKRAEVRKAKVADDFLMKVAMYRLPAMPIGRAWMESQWITHLETKRALGYAVAEILRDRVKAKAQILVLKAEAAELQARVFRLQAADTHPDFATSDLFEVPL